MNKISDKKYFNLNKRMNRFGGRGISLFMFFGVRGTGKSRTGREYGIRDGLESYLESKDENRVRQFGWVRRTKTLIEKITQEQKFTKDIAIKKPYILDSNRNGVWLGEEWEQFNKAGDLIKKYKRVCRLGNFFSLWTPELYKSDNWEQIKTLFVDEYMVEQGSGYLTNEPNKLMSIIESVGRNRKDFKVIMFSNNITKTNPYTSYFDIGLEEIPDIGCYNIIDRVSISDSGKPIKVRIYIEFVDKSKWLSEVNDDSAISSFSSGTEYNKYSQGGEYQVDNTRFITSHPKSHQEIRFNFICGGNELSVWRLGKNTVWIRKEFDYSTNKTFHATQYDADLFGQIYYNADWFAYELRYKAANLNVFYQSSEIRDIVIKWISRVE